MDYSEYQFGNLLRHKESKKHCMFTNLEEFFIGKCHVFYQIGGSSQEVHVEDLEGIPADPLPDALIRKFAEAGIDLEKVPAEYAMIHHYQNYFEYMTETPLRLDPITHADKSDQIFFL